MPPLEKLGPYKLTKMLGRGGMGAVYAGINENTNESAAVKVLSPHLADNTDFRERFVGEVETLKKLKHPNIVQLYGYGQEEEHLFFVMELVEGKSLQDEMSSGRRFEWREVAKIGVDICRALKHAHDNGVIHRDLKPANLLIDKSDQVKLTDFGIAKLYGGTQITAAGGIIGTADYMSPEQAEGKAVTVRSDLYSLGSVMYALITGRPPFAAKTLAEVIHGLRFEKPIAVRRIAMNTPAEFEAIILQLLEKDPAKRIASAFAVSNLLRAMEHALSVDTQVGTAPEEEEKPASPKINRNLTHGGGSTDATLATQASPSNASPSANAGATLDFSNYKPGDDAEEYRLSGPVIKNERSLTPNINELNTSIPAESSESTAVTRSKFITLAEEEAQQREREKTEEEKAPVWLIVIGLIFVVVLFAGVYGYAVTPPSANALYTKINEAASEGPEKLADIESDIKQFMSLFPQDSRVTEVAQHLETLEMMRMQRRFEIEARIGGADSLAPVKRAYLDAVRLADEQPQLAIEKFKAITDVFAEEDANASPLEKKHRKICVQLAKKQVKVLESQVQDIATNYRNLIKTSLARAKEIEQKHPEDAAAIRQGLVTLYGDKPWAEDLLQEFLPVNKTKQQE